MIETAVLAAIQRRKRATFAALCAGLPFAKRSITEALRRLSSKKMVVRRIGCAGEFWTAITASPTKPASSDRRAPTKNG